MARPCSPFQNFVNCSANHRRRTRSVPIRSKALSFVIDNFPKIAVSTSDPQPIVISGPSGVGKSTLCQMLQEAHPNVFATTVSHTTRERRPGEVEGQSYFYVSRDKFESLIRQHTFVEHTEFNGNLYGTSKQTVIDQTAKGSTVILDIEMEGVKQLKQELLKPNPPIRPRFVFIQPPSFEVLEERLRGRGTETESSIQKRLNQAKAELEYAQTGAHDIIITNRDLTEAFKELENFIFTTV